MNRRRRRIRVAKVKFSVGQYVRISKEKMKFAKGGEQTFHGNISRYESHRAEITTRLRARGFKQDADIGTIIRGRAHTCAHHGTDRVQDR